MIGKLTSIDGRVLQRDLPRKERTPNSKCVICERDFYALPSMKKIGRGRFCSKKCMGVSKRGMVDKNFRPLPKGTEPWNKGMNRIKVSCLVCNVEFGTVVSANRKYCSKKCADVGKLQPWSEMSYGAKHHWVRVNFGTPSKCENCGTEESKKFEWANLSGDYRQDREDWKRLCCQCHRRFDVGTKNKIHI